LILHLVAEQPLIFFWGLKLSQVQAFDQRAHGWQLGLVIFPRNFPAGPSFVSLVAGFLAFGACQSAFRELDTAEGGLLAPGSA
jgi:hypothetical protein